MTGTNSSTTSTTSTTMRVARLHAVGDIRVADEPMPTPAEDEELVRVTAVGICGSDLHWFTDGAIGDAGLDAPLVLGHEMAGEIASGPRAGQRVAIDPAIPCWHCDQCREGRPNLCPNVRFAGHGGTDGGFREYLAWPADRLHPVPDALSDSEVSLLEPLGVALHAVDLAHARVGSTAAVVGCGPIGLLTITLLQLAGAHRVVAVEPLAHRRDAAAKLGAAVVDSSPDVGDVVGADVDVVIETAGNDVAVDHSVALCRAGGRVVLAGIPGDDRTEFVASTARRKGLTFAMSRRMGEVYPRTIGLLAARRIDTTGLLTDYRGLDRTPEAFADAAARIAHKIVVVP